MNPLAKFKTPRNHKNSSFTLRESSALSKSIISQKSKIDSILSMCNETNLTQITKLEMVKLKKKKFGLPEISRKFNKKRYMRNIEEIVPLLNKALINKRTSYKSALKFGVEETSQSSLLI